MVESSKQPETEFKYIVTIVGHDKQTDGEYMQYRILIEIENEPINFMIADRYSSIEKWQSSIRKDYVDSPHWPEMPKKKFFGNLDPDFVTQRQQQLQTFLNLFLNDPVVLKNYKTLDYFKAKASFDIDKTNVEKLILLIKEKRSAGQSSARELLNSARELSSIRVIKIKSAISQMMEVEP